MGYLKIDEIATMTGLTKRTIRYYEEIGILPPPNRTEGGTRLYTTEDAEYLKRMITAKEVLGFSLQELQRFIQISDSLENTKSSYRSAKGMQEQKDSLEQLVVVVDEQLALLEEKLIKFERVQMELKDLKERALNKVRQINENKGE
ncbi:MerR family transcriptional regulator [Peribacillus kribbensis]|uniref:MerR family transcriptional regulator n=1 Tax=Peribacillus kribbensis TaxID=356658 RepID=UPI0004292B19|nr:MerR family transcriptional regulator [Peribacillus kribbensis]